MAFVSGIFIWLDYKKQTESNQFKDQSSQSNISDKNFGLVNLRFGGNASPTPKPITSPVVQPSIVPDPIYVEPVAPTLEQTFGVSKAQLDSIGHLNWLERLGLDIVVILVVIVLGGLLDALGGDNWLFCRRYVMPFLVACGVSTIVYTFNPVWYSWLVGLLVTPAMGTLCLGYMSGDNFGRAEWLFLQSVVLGLFLVVISYFFHAHFLAWYLYVWYTVTTGVWGGLYKNWEQFFGDWVTGAWLCSLVLYVFLSLTFSL